MRPSRESQVMPLDAHVSHVTARPRLDPGDPVSHDAALSRLGILNAWSGLPRS